MTLAQISKMVETIEDDKDLWIGYEVGDSLLSTSLFLIGKEKKPNGSYMPTVAHKTFYKALKNNKDILV